MTDSTSPSILVVEDNEDWARGLCRQFERYWGRNPEPIYVTDISKIERVLKARKFDIILLDLAMDDSEVDELRKIAKSIQPGYEMANYLADPNRLPEALKRIEYVRRNNLNSLIIIQTAHRPSGFSGDPLKVLCKKFGADEFEWVNRKNKENLDPSEMRTLAEGVWQKFNRRCQMAEDLKSTKDVGLNLPGLEEVKMKVMRFSEDDAPVLIQGETGVGKETVAKAIHENSERKHKTWQVVNCASIQQNLVESELFGHKRGAFTGAIANRKGRIELANESTLFLDEVSLMSLDIQVKLLRVLQENEFQPVGSEETKYSDFRLICATNESLEEAVENKKFREDLLYRINVLPIDIPPLRERKDDIPILAQYFLNKFAQKKAKNCTEVDMDFNSKRILLDHPWRGNVRELENIMRRSVILSEDMRCVRVHGLNMGKNTQKADKETTADRDTENITKAEACWQKLLEEGEGDFKKIPSNSKKNMYDNVAQFYSLGVAEALIIKAMVEFKTCQIGVIRTKFKMDKNKKVLSAKMSKDLFDIYGDNFPTLYKAYNKFKSDPNLNKSSILKKLL